jgi:hypothetical protein
MLKKPKQEEEQGEQVRLNEFTYLFDLGEKGEEEKAPNSHTCLSSVHAICPPVKIERKEKELIVTKETPDCTLMAVSPIEKGRSRGRGS